jgi:hypothetical protein
VKDQAIGSRQAAYPRNTRVILDALMSGGGQTAATNGRSMEPLIRHGDTLVLTGLNSAPRPGDIVVYPDSAGNLVAHRYLALQAPGLALIRGDRLHAKIELIPTEILVGKVIKICREKRCLDPNGYQFRLQGKAWLFYRSWREVAGQIKKSCQRYIRAF